MEAGWMLIRAQGILAAGSAFAWGLDAARVPYRVLFTTSWGFCVFGMLCVVPLVWWRIRGSALEENEALSTDVHAQAESVEKTG
jgi:hypothetical protein